MRNPFESARIAERYEDWYAGRGRREDALEQQLLRKLLDRLPGTATALEVGAGTGHFTRFLAKRGIRSFGLDASRPMLAEAVKRGPEAYVQGDADALPFQDASVDLVAFVTTLEFLADPRRALAEATRVARRGLLLGVLNRHSLLNQIRKRRGGEIWQSARFFTPAELAALVSETAGPRLQDLCWRTTLWPVPGIADLPLPWGAFVGMVASLKPVQE